VGGIDEEGRGQVEVYVRRDKQLFQFAFNRAIPGEKLHLQVGSAKHDRFKKKEAGRYRLKIHERGSASPDEVAPRCEHFSERCGGCTFQNLAYDAQLREKHLLLERRLQEYGLDSAVLRPPLASPSEFGFHGRTEFRFFQRNGLQLGLHPAGSPVPVPISRCELQPSVSQSAFEATLAAVRADKDAQAFDERTGRGWLRGATFRAGLRAGGGDGLAVLVTLATAPGTPEEALRRIAARIRQSCPDVLGVLWSLEEGEPELRGPGWRSGTGKPQVLLAGEARLELSAGGMRVEASPEASVRPNLLLGDEICKVVESLAEVQPGDTVWDAFCGQGTLSLPLLARCRRLIALDRSEPALKALKRNAGAHGLGERLTVVRMDLGRLSELCSVVAGLPSRPAEGDSEDSDAEEDDDGAAQVPAPAAPAAADALPRPDVLLCDPGRNGLPKAFRQILYSTRVRTLVYVGMGRPLLRDCALLQRRGYELRAMVPFDSHPHSPRLEVAVQFRWRGVDPSQSDSDGEGVAR